MTGVSRDIAKSIMALQFQVRVNQRLDHVAEALQALKENLASFRNVASTARMSSRSADSRVWLNSGSTMNSERQAIEMESERAIADCCSSGSASDVDLFESAELF